MTRDDLLGMLRDLLDRPAKPASMVDRLIAEAAARWGIDPDALGAEVRATIDRVTPMEALDLMGRLQHNEHPPPGFARVGPCVDTTAREVLPELPEC